MTEPSARQRFVDAIRGLKDDTYAQDTDNAIPLMQAACDAFADAECFNGMDCGGQESKFAATEHAACRAELRKAVFND